MGLSIAYPMIQGVRHDWSSLDIKLDGISFFGIKSFNWDDGLEPTDVYGLGAQKQGRTRGVYNCNADFELYFSDAIVFEQQMLTTKAPVGLYEASFNISINVQAEGGFPPWSVVITGARIKKRTPSGMSSGQAEALAKKYDLNCMNLLENNVPPFLGFRQM